MDEHYKTATNTHLAAANLRQNTENISIKWSIVLVQRRFPPTTRMEAPLCTVGYGEYNIRSKASRAYPSGIGAFRPGIRNVG